MRRKISGWFCTFVVALSAIVGSWRFVEFLIVQNGLKTLRERDPLVKYPYIQKFHYEVNKQLEKGMSKDSVSAILGSPQNTDSTYIWIWCEKTEASTSNSEWFDMGIARDGYYLIFYDDKLLTNGLRKVAEGWDWWVLANELDIGWKDARAILLEEAQSPPLTSQSSKTKSIDIGDGVILELVWVPGSTFRMGSRKSPSELAEIYPISGDAFTPEQPLHDVTVNDFWMGKYEVTNAQFRRYKPPHTSNIQDTDGQSVFSFFCKKYRGYSFDGENQPVVNVSWEEARGFCDWLSGITGETVRLPFEAEWEYAGRAGTDSLYYWGNDEKSVGAYENIYDLSAEKELKLTHQAVETTDTYTVTSPVGRFKPNRFGLYDMAGNVSEWCSDWYRSKYYSDSPKMNPQGPLEGKARVIRGGNWECGWHEIRPSFRRGSLPDYKVENLGFRVVVQ